MVKEKINNIESEELTIRAINVNRNFVSVTYESDLSNNDVKELFTEELSDETIFGITFDSDSLPDSNDMVKIIKFKMR